MKFVAISQNQIQFQLQINQFPEFVAKLYKAIMYGVISKIVLPILMYLKR